MKKPPPAPPRDAPAGTIWFGGPMAWFSMSIEIQADDLVPDEVTVLLGVAPTRAHQKGKPWITPNGKHVRTRKSGRWSLELKPSEANEWDVAEAARMLLGRVSSDPMVWDTLSSRAKIRLSIGLSLESFNQGILIAPDLLRLLAERKMQLDLDIYGGDGEGSHVTPQAADD